VHRNSEHVSEPDTMVSGVTRRRLLAAAGAASLVLPGVVSSDVSRVASLDWALAETLLVLGVEPVATVAASDWPRFVIEPPLPSTVADLGLQQEINLELLAMLDPDLILTSPFIQGLDSVLPRIARTEKLSIFEPTTEPLAHPQQLTRSIAALVHREARAEAFLELADNTFDQCHLRLQKLDLRPTLVLSFIDPRHARVYGGSGLFQNVFERIGAVNAWNSETGYWGFSTIGVEKLATYSDAQVVVLGPVPADLDASLARSPLWYELPFVKADRVTRLPPVFMFGAMPAALRFARVFTDHMERRYG